VYQRLDHHKTIPNLVMSTVCDLENGAFIVSFPIKNGGSFHSYVENGPFSSLIYRS
jgi:hypothetical protein